MMFTKDIDNTNEDIINSLEIKFRTTDIFGMNLSVLIEGLIGFEYNGENLFNNYFQKCIFILWYSKMAFNKNKLNNGTIAFIKAKDYYNLILYNINENGYDYITDIYDYDDFVYLRNSFENI